MFTSWRARTFASVRESRNYRIYFCGQLVSVTGTWMQDAALPWLVLQETRSGFDVGVLIFCRFVPVLVLGLYSGVVADRFDNRRLLMATQFASMLVAAALAAMALSGWTPVWAIFVLATLGGAALAFDGPNRHAFVYQLVGREWLPNAVGLNSSIFNAGRAVGPALGGVVIALFGVAWCFVYNALSFLAILISLLLLKVSELHPVERSRKESALAAMREGVGFLRRSAPTMVVMSLFLVASLTGFNFRVLVPILAEITLHAPPSTFGLIYASFGVGALFGSLAAATRGEATWKIFLIGALVCNGAVLAIAPVRSVAVAAVLLFIVGAGYSNWLTTGQAILQLTSPDRLRGRVISLYLLIYGGLQPLGALLSGWLAEVGGTELAFGLSGGLGVLAALLATMRLRRLGLLGVTPQPVEGGDRVAADAA